LDLIRTGAAVTGDLPVGADFWPLIVFAASYGLLLLLLTATVIIVSSHSGRLRQVSRHLRELSNVVQQQARAIEQLSDSPKSDLAPVPRVSPPGDIAENQIPGIVQSADGPVDLQEQIKTLREVILKAASKND
jgi:hypothetical protein